MSTSLIETAKHLVAAPGVVHTTLLFISVVHRLWDYLHLVHAPRYPGEPAPLHPDVLAFLSNTVIPESFLDRTAEVRNLWDILRAEIPTWKGPLLEAEVDELLRKHGPLYNLGAYMLLPPHRTCVNPSCANVGSKLGKHYLTEARLYTLRNGVLPVYEVPLYCKHCKTRYRYAYSVNEAKQDSSHRVYYTTIPRRYIHAQSASFLEDRFFENLTCSAHVSTTNLARSYNSDLGQTENMLQTSLSTNILQSTVLDGFFLHALLRRAQRHDIPLEIAHRGVEQSHRFEGALHQFNTLMAGTGQPFYAHACHGCFKIFLHPETGQLQFIRAVVTDGVTIGHPCCRVAGCQNELMSNKDHFCGEHHALRNQCLVRGCKANAEPGRITCTEPSHRAREEAHIKASEPALLDLNRRLLSDGVPTSARRHATSLSTQHRDLSVQKAGGSGLTLEFARSTTHHDQLATFGCGVIITRMSMHHNEGVSSVKDFLKRVFPYPWLLPTHIFYDHACGLLQHLRAQKDRFFDMVRLVVDVFHARNHHKDDGDTFCNNHTNPALCPELLLADGKWTINSSVAEQTNVWYGAFQAITREMSMARFNFFLDEMVSLRNEWFIGELERAGKQPFLLDFSAAESEWRQAHPQSL